uniref:C-CAP/cofactor C-like domain-containing protein n=1 Tax=Panagrellus redivivus TaxID=6233 RepID=A0A7E4UYL0_PANRE
MSIKQETSTNIEALEDWRAVDFPSSNTGRDTSAAEEAKSDEKCPQLIALPPPTSPLAPAESPEQREFFLDASFGTPAFPGLSNYHNFGSELYTFEEFLRAPSSSDSEEVPSFQNVDLSDSDQRELRIIRNLPGFQEEDTRTTSPTLSSTDRGDPNPFNLPVADVAHAVQLEPSPVPRNEGVVPLPVPPNPTSDASISQTMGFLKFLCCFKTVDRSTRYHAPDEPPSTVPTEAASARAQYSWDKREIDPANYTVANKKTFSLIKKDGEVAGQQFSIDNLQDCIVMVLDHSGTITVDDSQDCLFVFGPCSGSIFIRNCKNCRIYSISKQFRVRDSDITAHLFCATSPIIEESKIDVFPLYINYDKLDEHMLAAQLSPFYNRWSEVYDFTPAKQELHFRINFESPEDDTVDKLELVASNSNLSFIRDNSYLVVADEGKVQQAGEQIALVMVQQDAEKTSLADFLAQTRLFVLQVLEDPTIVLVKSTEVKIQKGELSLPANVGMKFKGLNIFFEFLGVNSITTLEKCVKKFTTANNIHENAIQVIQNQFRDTIYRFVDMKHSV